MALTLTTKARHEPPSTPPDAAVRSINPRSFPFRTNGAAAFTASTSNSSEVSTSPSFVVQLVFPEIHLLPVDVQRARRKLTLRRRSAPREELELRRRRGRRIQPAPRAPRVAAPPPVRPRRSTSASSDWSHSSAACPTFRPTPREGRDGSRRAASRYAFGPRASASRRCL